MLAGAVAGGRDRARSGPGRRGDSVSCGGRSVFGPAGRETCWRKSRRAMCCYRPVLSTMTSLSRSGAANAVGVQLDWSPRGSMSSGMPSVIVLSGFTDRASGSRGSIVPRTDPTASGSASVTGTRTGLTLRIRLLRPPRRGCRLAALREGSRQCRILAGAGRVATTRYHHLVRSFSCGPRHWRANRPSDSRCSVARRTAGAGGSAASSDVSVEVTSVRAWVSVSAAVAPQLANTARPISPRRHPGVQGRFVAVLRAYRNVRFRFMLDISVPVPGLRFRDAVPVGARQQFR